MDYGTAQASGLSIHPQKAALQAERTRDLGRTYKWGKSDPSGCRAASARAHSPGALSPKGRGYWHGALSLKRAPRNIRRSLLRVSNTTFAVILLLLLTHQVLNAVCPSRSEGELLPVSCWTGCFQLAQQIVHTSPVSTTQTLGSFGTATSMEPLGDRRISQLTVSTKRNSALSNPQTRWKTRKS